MAVQGLEGRRLLGQGGGDARARLRHLLHPLHPLQLAEQGLHARLQPADGVGVVAEGGQRRSAVVAAGHDGLQPL